MRRLRERRRLVSLKFERREDSTAEVGRDVCGYYTMRNELMVIVYFARWAGNDGRKDSLSFIYPSRHSFYTPSSIMIT